MRLQCWFIVFYARARAGYALYAVYCKEDLFPSPAAWAPRTIGLSLLVLVARTCPTLHLPKNCINHNRNHSRICRLLVLDLGARCSPACQLPFHLLPRSCNHHASKQRPISRPSVCSMNLNFSLSADANALSEQRLTY